MTSMFKGSYVALITPMLSNGDIDYSSLLKIVNWHIENGTNGLVPVGTTGESPVLTREEHCRVLKVVAKESKNRIKVIAGCSSNNTAEAMHFHDYAYEIGADAALHVTGYYNRPSQAGLFRHFEVISHRNNLPIVVYNVPARTVVNIDTDTMYRLSKIDTVVGVKDATADLSRPVIERPLLGENFSMLSGEDATAVAYNVSGGNGCISVTANVAPGLCAKMQNACQNGNYLEAIDIQKKLTPLHQALFLEPSPTGIKYACYRVGLCGQTSRLPMIEIQQKTKDKIDIALDNIYG